MLISFAVTNWACFRDRQELSAEAVSRAGDAFAFDTGVRRVPRLNRVTAVYGANGSGKSYLLKAMAFMRDFVVESAKGSQAGHDIPVVPFLFDVATRAKPTIFEVCFIADGVVYEYVFAVDGKRVHEERLSAWLPGHPMRRLLRRRYDAQADTEEWRFGSVVRGPKAMWRSSTRENALLVSVAAQLNSDAFRPVIDWFQRLGVVTPAFPASSYTARRIAKDKDFGTRVMNLLRDADVCGDASPHALNLTDESDGTQRLFLLAGPWLDALDNSRVFVVDDLDSSLHPLLVSALIKRINHESPDGKGSCAQLVTTLHDVSLLDHAFHRGQIWMTEKDRHSDACSLKPLSDYRRHSKEEIAANYLGGRFGGVPVIVERVA